MIAMKYYTSTTQFNCGIDLHARQMYVCLMDRDGKKLVHTNIKNNDFDFFLKLVAPYRHDLTVCAECMFGWYWLADACQAAGLHFVLAHALYLKAIHGGKNKNDRIDSEKIAHLLRTNLIPPAYVYPAEKRPLRALLRHRPPGPTARGAPQQQVQGQHRAGHQARPRRLFHAQKPHRLRPRTARRGFEPKLIWPWRA
jgi:transposase